MTSGEENPNVSLEEGGEERKPAEGETPADGEQPAEPEEEEVKEMTLDEYKAQVAAERAGKSDFKIRKVIYLVKLILRPHKLFRANPGY